MKYVISGLAVLALTLTASAQESSSSKERSKQEDAAVSEPAPEPQPAPVGKSGNSAPAATPTAEPVAEPAASAPTQPKSAVRAVALPTAGDDVNFNAPLPPVLVDTLSKVCLPMLRGEQSMAEGVPSSASEGISESMTGRLIARPQDGDMWTVRSLEGEILIGSLAAREGACQVMAVSPIGDVVMNQVTDGLTGGESTFEVVDETGSDSGTPIHWRRLRSAEGEFIDVLHYKGVPGGQASTIHVIVG